MWLAPVEAPMDYRYTRRHTRITTEGTDRYRIGAVELPPGVHSRTVTISLPPSTRAIEVDGRPHATYRRNGKLLADLDLASSRQVRIVSA